jgi:hypothetical protein
MALTEASGLGKDSVGRETNPTSGVCARRSRQEPGAGQVPRMVAEVAITLPDQSSGCTAT